MLSSLPTFTKLIQLIKRIPYIQGKHTYHLVENILELSNEDLDNFYKTLLQLKNNLERCIICFSWKESSQKCLFCQGERDQSIICVVETWIDAISLERSRIFNGVFHILGGRISPIDGINYFNLHFQELEERIIQTDVQEVIVATNQTPEGEATAAHIEKVVKKTNKPIAISYLATGVPVGTSLEFIDKITLAKAISNRRKLY